MKFRDDIDGLRAVAVLSVIGAHAGLVAHGGFVGVDVFFVISGYLITGNIASDLEGGRFSIATFYRRRIRRILPALIAATLAAMAAGAAFLLPIEFVDLAWSALAATVSVSNIYFWSEAGYFTNAAKMMPLLHTWSLGIEEQFYILFPLLLALFKTTPRRAIGVLAAICAASLALAAWQVQHDATSAFYLLPARAWELGIGALLALRPASGKAAPAWLRFSASILGFALIVAVCLLYTDRTPFPGLAAAAPCFGAALMIWAGDAGASWRAAPMNAALSVQPFVFIGKISYSLYLWHWPILVFAALALNRENFSLLEKGAMIAVMIAAATLSWAIIEQPIRKEKVRLLRGREFWTAGAALATMCVVFGGVLATQGGAARLTPSQAHLQTFIRYDTVRHYDYGRCFLGREHRATEYDAAHCLGGDARVLLMGDSFAAHLLPGLRATFGPVRQATASGCKPLLHRYRADAATCASVHARIFEGDVRGLDTIVLSARWGAADADDLRPTLIALRQKARRVIVVGAPPQYDGRLARALVLQEMRGAPTPAIAAERLAAQRRVDDALARAAAGLDGVVYVSALRHFCDADTCTQWIGRDPAQWDYGHLTAAGSQDLAQTFPR